MIKLRARSMKAAAIVALSVLFAGVSIASVGATTASATTESKVWVCKYVTTPNDEEVLKKGNDGLVWVSENTLKDQPIAIGASFPDAQGRSVVVQVGGERPDISTVSAVCPGYTQQASPVTLNVIDECGVDNDTITGIPDNSL